MSDPIQALIHELTRLPSVGEKTATRLAFHILKVPADEAAALARAIADVKEKVRLCAACFHLTGEERCAICSDPRRDSERLCVIEEPLDLLAIEKARSFRGRYHVLHGALSPIDGIGPEKLRIAPLLDRIPAEGVREVIIATNPSVEGEATAIYLARILRPLGVKVSRIAHGIPMGGELEFTDELTIGKAIANRREL
jgi:recombination protein RecR